MKQHVTNEQLTEVAHEQYNRFKELFKLPYAHPPYASDISIGKMLEVLENNDSRACFYIENNPGLNTWQVSIISNIDFEVQRCELVDCLWEAVKTLL